MNTILHLVNIKLQHDRGVQTGLVGLIAIGLFLLSAFAWSDYIHPFITKIGLVAAAERIGLISQGSPEITAWNVVMFLIVLLVILWLLAMIALGYVLLAMAFPIPFLLPILLPIFLVYWLPKLIGKGIINLTYRFINPEAYKESKRLRRNYELTLYIREIGKIIDKKDVLRQLHRLPTYKDSFFHVGITYDRDAYVLLPSFTVNDGVIKGIKVKKTNGKKGVELNLASRSIENIDVFEIEESIDCSVNNDFRLVCETVLLIPDYRSYVDNTYYEYKERKMDLVTKIETELIDVNRHKLIQQLNKLVVYNEDIVLLMRS